MCGFLVPKSQPPSAVLLLIKYCIKSLAPILKGKMWLNTSFNLYMTACVCDKTNSLGIKAVLNTMLEIVQFLGCALVLERKICLGVRRKDMENKKLS